jgi:kynurenine formamidase
MCVPACTQKIATDLLNRRNFLRTAAGLGVVATAGACSLSPPPPPRAQGVNTPAPAPVAAPGVVNFTRIVDLTHTLTIDFPTFTGKQQLELESLTTLAKDGYNMQRWLLVEHTGTHMDAPLHFSDHESADQIPVENLHGPLAIVDIRRKAAQDPDAQLTPEDLKSWEAKHGPLPAGAIVAMLSGWDQFVTSPKFRNADAAGVLHFPGFHVEAVEYLLSERDVKGILVDTLSLDYGPSPDFAVHYRWLPASKWGVENVANLGDLPASGAHVLVGGPKIAGATGGMTRLFALV